ncbi:MAG: hypothetical protein NTY07_02405 [Bacteroidia bacterium]|nr:hypothetical protein [Bacteroidia bacterium]
MRNTLLLALLTLVNIVTFAQKTINDPKLENKLFKPYISYFENDHEWVYTHMNKSAYIPGDDIWFTSYVLNPVNKRLNPATSKLYIELWSPEKKLVSRKILYVKAGTTNHYIHIADSLTHGTYCFRAYTNWMRNFYPENDLNKLITVLGKDKEFENEIIAKHFNESADQVSQKEKSTAPDTRPDYDIQFLPESGTFLEGAENVLGIKATDPYGKGVKITGKVFTAGNNEITSFSTTELGMNRIIIPEVKNQQYFAKITLPDGTNRELMLPKAEPRGVIIQINPYRSDVVWFKIFTNETTRKLNGTYMLMIHANGVLFNNYRIRFSAENAIQFRIKKEQIGRGIIYATVFDENLTPVAERIFYNQGTTAKGNLTLKAEPIINDTVKVNVQITDSLTRPGFAKLSISVLPGETVLSHFDNSLQSESILRPALRGNIENPNGYFEKNDIDHLVAIDHLLLTQGWRKYDWPTILKDTIHNFTYPFEEAFTVEGSVKNWLKNKPELKSKISFISPSNKIFLMAPVDSAGTFKLDRAYLTDSTWVIASASSDKGKNWNRVLQMSIPEFFMGVPDFQQTIAPHENVKEVAGDIPRLTKGVIQLKEIVITAQKKNLFADIMNIGIMDKIQELTEDNYRDFYNMEMLLETIFNIRTEVTPDGYHFNMGRGQSRDPVMMIDGMKVQDPQDILNFPMELVEAVAVNKSGLGGGMDGAGGTIAIKS